MCTERNKETAVYGGEKETKKEEKKKYILGNGGAGLKGRKTSVEILNAGGEGAGVGKQ